ncbi:restriction endonuclease subunit S [Salipiger pacificus]|nr:restriction endonuclease subunit S [Alloyangia pacifica]
MTEVGYHPLAELSDQSRKITYGIVQPGKLHDEGVPIVRVNNFRGNSLDLTDRLAVAPDIEKKYQRSRPKTGDLLVSLVGSIGQVALAPSEIEGWNLARAVGLVPFDDIKKARWAYFALQTAASQQFIQAHANTTVQATFNLKDLARIPIPSFEGKAQEEALTALMLLEDKIELNRRMNETLEAMARAVFRDWFVDFGPTRRKAAGETDPVAVLGGLLLAPEKSASLAALFPDSLGDQGLPSGWKPATLSGIAELNPESWTARRHPHEVEYVDLANTKWGVIESTAQYRWSDAPSRARRVARIGDTIVGTVRPGNGSFSFVGRDGLTVSTGFAVLRPRQEDWQSLVYCAATDRTNIERLAYLADGGAYPAIRPDVVLDTPFPDVNAVLYSEFGKVTNALFELIESYKRENETLAATRDLLLPKLMSGQIRLTDAEGAA